MHVAVALTAGIVFKVRGWRTRPVRHRRPGLSHDALDDVVKQDDVILPNSFAVGWRQSLFEIHSTSPVAPARLDFVVAAPDRNPRMISQPFYLLRDFLADIFLECEVSGHHRASEHEVLPHHDAEFVADVVEVIGLVVSAAPMPDHVHVRIARGLQDFAVLRGSDARLEAVELNHVRAFGENRNAIYDKRETLAPLVWHTAQFKLTQASAQFGAVLKC